MRAFFTLVLVVSLSGIGFQAATKQPQRPDQPNCQPQQQTNTSNQQSAKMFQGKIARAVEQLVFWDSSTQTAYQLDDQSEVAPCEGKDVKVKGRLIRKRIPFT